MMKKFVKNLFKRDIVININEVENNQTYLYEEEFTYILHLYELYKLTQKIPGHIVEIGVGNGRNSIIFGQLIKKFGDNSTKKYHGIDTFDGYVEKDLVKQKYLDKNAWKDIDINLVNERLKSLGLSDICQLYKLNAYEIKEKFINQGGFQFQPDSLLVSLLYVDCNSYGAAKHTIDSLMPYMSKGSVIAIDEKRLGGETKALKEIANEYNLTLEKDMFPSIYTYIKLNN